ncbi:TIGR02186 family protein [Consotaella salsifontis]|nr:TIGR02186 family protein [Consotaella salsifontis]
MARHRARSLICGVLLALAGPGVAQAQETQTQAQAQAVTPAAPAEPRAESFEIGLSTEVIAIGADFNGARLTVFGALEGGDYQLRRQGRYDILVALEGPRRPVVVRKKERTAGVWINRESESFEIAPASYSLASTRRLNDVAPAPVLRQLSVGEDYIRLALPRPEAEAQAPGSGEGMGEGSERRDEFAAALRRIRSASGLYAETYGSVEFVGPTLFRADLRLPADLPVGEHVARAFLFRDGVMVRQRQLSLRVVKAGFESAIHGLAVDYGYLYGLFAVFLAVVTGWLGRVLFKRD